MSRNAVAGILIGCAALTLGACTTGSGPVAEEPLAGPLASVSGHELPSLAAPERALAAAAEQQVLASPEAGKPVEWQSATGADRRGSVVAGPLVERNGVACRPFTHTIYVGGVPQTSRRAACRHGDGRWKVAG
jgi:surface antigen